MAVHVPDRVTLEMGEARVLVSNYHHRVRKEGREKAREWLLKAFSVTRRVYGGSEALERIKGYMRQIEREEMCLEH